VIWKGGPQICVHPLGEARCEFLELRGKALELQSQLCYAGALGRDCFGGGSVVGVVIGLNQVREIDEFRLLGNFVDF
jgi:hypothetical protein